MGMQLGSSGPLVRSWQQFLVDQQLLSAAALEDAGGRFSAATAAATAEYQRRRGLLVDGLVGDKTLAQASQDGYTGVAVLPQYTLLYGLQSGAFAGWDHPAALVYAPPDFDPGQLAVVVYFHGMDNNIENVVQKSPLSPDYPVADLLGQLERTPCNALLIVPELRYNGNTTDPGRLAEPGALQRLLTEVLAKLPPPLGGLSVGDLRRVVLIAHSGGYRAAAPMALGGGLRVDELYLLDSLYGLVEQVAAFLDAVLGELASTGSADPRSARRLVNLYLGGGKPAELSRELGRRAQVLASHWPLPAEALLFSDEPLDPAQVPSRPAVLSQRVIIEHSDLPLRFVGPLLAQSGLPLRRS